MMLIDPNDEFSVYSLVRNVDLSILNSCSFLRDEAIPSLNASTVLNIFNHFRQSDPLANLPDDFLMGVRTIQVEVNAFLHIDRTRLPLLRQVNLIHEVEGLESFVQTVATMVNATDPVNASMQDVIDWRWKLKQFAHLGAEEGFTVNMTVMWDCYSEGPETRLDMDLDLMSGMLVGLKGLIGNKEVAVIDAQQAVLDWEMYGAEEPDESIAE